MRVNIRNVSPWDQLGRLIQNWIDSVMRYDVLNVIRLNFTWALSCAGRRCAEVVYRRKKNQIKGKNDVGAFTCRHHSLGHRHAHTHTHTHPPLRFKGTKEKKMQILLLVLPRFKKNRVFRRIREHVRARVISMEPLCLQAKNRKEDIIPFFFSTVCYNIHASV